MPTAEPDPGLTSTPDVAGAGRPAVVARRIALLAGLLGLLLAIAVPLLPVSQTTAQLNWPQDGATTPVTAPLVSYAPTELDATIPCSAAVRTGSGGVLLSTAPAEAGNDVREQALFVTAADDEVTVRSSGTLIARAPLSDVASSACTTITVTSDAERTAATFHGLTGADGAPLAGAVSDHDVRPQVVGVFTDLAGPAPEGLSFHATVDTRYDAAPTLAKWLAMAFGLALTALSLAALSRLDRADGRRLRPVIPQRWRYIDAKDMVVIGVLLLWHIIGANTSDDGYELGMARAAETAGYMPNYFRWFGAPEAPFGYPYYIFTWLTHLSPSSVVLRLPALVAAIVCWLVLSREIVPRFGRAARRSSPALWTAALVLLAFWLPYNNGLRPEPYIAAGILVTWVAVERAIATGRMLPLGIALGAAGLTLTGGPTGTLCFAVLLAGAVPLVKSVIRHGRRVGFGAVLAPLVASVSVVLIVAFSRASLGPVLLATRMKEDVGPSAPWYLEYERYLRLLEPTPDGSIARRFAVLVMLLGLVVGAVLLVRRRGRIPGLAWGPSRRIVIITILSIVLMMFNPTKWTHHFGVFAGLGAAIAAMAVVAASHAVRHSMRNRALFRAGVLLVLAMTFTSANSWWYVAAYSVPGLGVWGAVLSAVFLGFAIAALVRAWRLSRGVGGDDSGADSVDGGNADGGVGSGRRRALQQRVRDLPGGAPLAISAGALVALEVASLAVGFAVQYPAYSVGLANVRSLAGDPCNLAYDVLVEPDANATMLQPAEPTDNPLGAVRQVNFSPNGLPVDVSYQRDDNGALVGNPDEPPDANSPGTGGGLLPEPGVNGSRMALPFGLDPATTPVLGSYMPDDPEAVADATSAWYALPPRSDASEVLAIAAAGEVKRENLEVEFGRSSGDGYEVVGSSGLEDVGPAPSWRSLRLPKSSIPDEAQVVRIVAHDDEPDPDDWIAFTPPRMPRLQTLQQYLGTDTPVLEDWPVPLTMTCQHQVDYNHGVAEVPDYRIQAEQGLAVVATNWEGAQGGGPLGWAQLLLTAESMPTYLDHDWDRQWGELIRYTPRVPDAVPAQLELGQERRSGWWTPGPIRY